MVLAGGGTGGHIYPALAVAGALRDEAGPEGRLDLLYIGTRGRLDERIVQPAGIAFETVDAAPLRTGSLRSMLSGAAKLVAGTAQARRLLARFRPHAVFATGGYASVPVGVAARIGRWPLVVYLPDLRPGWAVRLLARIATRVAATAEPSLDELPAGKSEAVGYPVRAAFWTADRTAARRALRLPWEEPVLLISGASQGARRLNTAVAQQLELLLGVCHVLHLTGSDDEPAMLARRDELPELLRGRYHVHGYLDDMAQAMAAADLAVMRAGASVLGELPAAGLPAILVPGVYEVGHDQRPNARYLEERGAAIVLENHRLDELSGLVRELIARAPRRQAMAEAMRALARPDAAQRLARIVMDVAARRVA